MANYVITSGSNSFTFEVDGKKAEYGSRVLIPSTPDGAGNIVRIKDTTRNLTTVAFIENEAVKIDLAVDTVDVNGTTVWADADALLNALKPIFFFSLSGTGGWNGEVDTRNDLPLTNPPTIGQVYLVRNPITETVLGIPYRTYQSGLYIKDADTGSLSDWRRLNVKVQFTTAEFRLADPADTSKQLMFNIASQAVGVIRNLFTQDKDYVIADAADVVAGDEGSVTIHSDVDDPGSGEIITDQERTDINASINVHSDVDLTGVINQDNYVLRWDSANLVFKPCLYQMVRSSALLINNTNVQQEKINVNINVQRLVIHKITISYNWSLNDGAQDLVAIASFGGANLMTALTDNTEVHRQEPKDVGGGDPDGRGTNQRLPFHRTFFVTPTVLGNNALILSFAGSANGDLASMWEACIEVEELISVIGN